MRFCVRNKKRIATNHDAHEKLADRKQAEGVQVVEVGAEPYNGRSLFHRQQMLIWEGVELLGCSSKQRGHVLNGVSYKVTESFPAKVRVVMTEEYLCFQARHRAKQ